MIKTVIYSDKTKTFISIRDGEVQLWDLLPHKRAKTHRAKQTVPLY